VAVREEDASSYKGIVARVSRPQCDADVSLPLHDCLKRLQRQLLW